MTAFRWGPGTGPELVAHAVSWDFRFTVTIISVLIRLRYLMMIRLVGALRLLVRIDRVAGEGPRASKRRVGDPGRP
jgi:hypothetical protein